MKQLSIVAATAFGLSACVAPAPVIADLESDKVVGQYAGQDTEVLQAEANRGCAIHGRAAVGPISSHLVGPYGPREYLFACQ